MDFAGMDLPDIAPGTVWLVGAGPGDPGLMTMYAAHGLAHAEVVVYDALVDRQILDLANPAAEMIFAGKRGGRPSAAQEDISRRLVERARAGRRVLRLKGKGVKGPGRSKKGDQLIELRIVVPEKTDPELEEAIKDWRAKNAYDPGRAF